MTEQPDAKSFRDAMRAFVGNCSVLTVGTGDKANGLVITSGISLSAEPPLVLACVNRTSSSWPLFSPGGVFGWSSLGHAHQGVTPIRVSSSARRQATRCAAAMVRKGGASVLQRASA